MGLRARKSRNNRRCRKERARSRRSEMIAHARPRCPLCETALCTDADDADVWRCFRCRSTFLRQGDELLPEMRGPTARLSSPKSVAATGAGVRRAA